MFSLWEKQSFLQNDLVIVGGGVVGLCVAASVLDKYPSQRVIILEKGILPTGQSAKDAGFLCTDSFTEFMDDIEKMGEKKTIALFYMRYLGLTRLIKRLGIQDTEASLHTGSFDIICDPKKCNRPMLKYANSLLRFLFNKNDVFVERNNRIAEFGLQPESVKYLVQNVLDGHVDTGEMMRSLYRYVTGKGAVYLTCVEVCHYEQISKGRVIVKAKSNGSEITFETRDLVCCVNAFATRLAQKAIQPSIDSVPVRVQMFITKPIEGLKVPAVINLHEGNYFCRRTRDERVIFGGRTIDQTAESTDVLGNTSQMLEHLRGILKQEVLPNTPFEVDYEWSAIMSFAREGKDKAPIVMKETENVIHTARLNNFGLAMAANVAEEVLYHLYDFTPSL